MEGGRGRGLREKGREGREREGEGGREEEGGMERGGGAEERRSMAMYIRG